MKLAVLIFVFFLVLIQSSISSPGVHKINSADELKRHGIKISFHEFQALHGKERNLWVKWKPQAEQLEFEGLRIEVRVYRVKTNKKYEHVSTTRHHLNKDGVANAEVVLGNLDGYEIELRFGDLDTFMDLVILSEYLDGFPNAPEQSKDDPFAVPDKKPKKN